MAEVIYLAADKEMPDEGDEMRWLRIDCEDGRFYGVGGSWKDTGEWVGYGSLLEDEVSLEKALAAAQRWAARYDVPKIWVDISRRD